MTKFKVGDVIRPKKSVPPGHWAFITEKYGWLTITKITEDDFGTWYKYYQGAWKGEIDVSVANQYFKKVGKKSKKNKK